MEALLKIKGGQKIGEKVDSIELLSQGEYTYNKDDISTVVYKESELTGMGNTTTFITVKEKQVSLKREGDINTELFFKEGDVNTNYYETENGDFSVTITTTEVYINLNDEGGKIKLEYTLSIDNNEPTINQFEIDIEQKI